MYTKMYTETHALVLNKGVWRNSHQIPHTGPHLTIEFCKQVLPIPSSTDPAMCPVPWTDNSTLQRWHYMTT